MRRQIDPTVDVVFKEILGSDHHKNLLVHFINAILGYATADRVVDVVLRNPFTTGIFLDSKGSVVDVKALDQRGREFQVEIQVSSYPALPQRMLHNWCSLYNGRIAKGQQFQELEPVIAIWLFGWRPSATAPFPSDRRRPKAPREKAAKNKPGTSAVRHLLP